MRKELELFKGKTLTFNAYFHRFGYMRSNTLSVLVEKVCLGNTMVTEHAWLEYVEAFKDISINSGDKITFTATIIEYDKKEGTDYGLANIKNIEVVEKIGRGTALADVEHHTFKVQQERNVWRQIKGDKKNFIHDASLEVQENTTILPDDKIEIELIKIKDGGYMEYAWKVERLERWNKGAFFNPLYFGQAIVVYGFYQIYLPDDLYFKMKDFYFKTFFSKPEITLPYMHNQVHYVKPDKFKHRKFLNFREDGTAIVEAEELKEREYTFKNLKEKLSNMADTAIFDLIQETYGTTTTIDIYLNERSMKHKDFEFLLTKVCNTFTSSSVPLKCRFLDCINKKES